MRSLLPVLIVEDNPVNKLAMHALVTQLGFACTAVSTGPEAIEAARRHTFAVILMDLALAGMSGFDATRKIRTFEFGSGRRAPIIAVTAMDDVVEECIAAGIDDVIAKPVDLAHLAAKIDLWAQAALPAELQVVEAQREDEPISPDALEKLYGSVAVDAIIGTFLTTTQALLSELESALETVDQPAIVKTVHELKSASLQVHAREMARLCIQLEAASRDHDWLQALALYASLAHAFLRVRSFASRKRAHVA